jgi:MoaA/NifB/PqqE/SkfB family radical SAM enzyme
MPKCNALNNVLSIKLRENVEFTPCCLFENIPINSFPVNKVSFNDFNKNYISKVKSIMENSWHSGCKPCERDEQQGFQSIRKKYSNILSGKEKSIEYLDIFLSNQCNLACKMCNPSHSTKLQRLVDSNPHLLKWYNNANIESSNYDLDTIFKDVNLTNVKAINFIGGEPFITSDLFNFIDFLDEKELIGNITCTVFTNGTFFPHKFLDKIKKFKSVIIVVSVDGIGELSNYIRTGFEWESISKNIDSWIEFKKANNNIYLKLAHTLQAYNIHQFDSIFEFCRRKNLTLEMYPVNIKEYLSYKVLPIEYRQELIESGRLKDQRILNILNKVKFDKVLFDEFKEFTYNMDKASNTSIEKTIPDLFKYFEQHE